MAEMRPQVGIGTHVTVELIDEQGGRGICLRRDETVTPPT